jgi:hypothetical protein
MDIVRQFWRGGLHGFSLCSMRSRPLGQSRIHIVRQAFPQKAAWLLYLKFTPWSGPGPRRSSGPPP